MQMIGMSYNDRMCEMLPLYDHHSFIYTFIYPENIIAKLP